MLWQAIGAVRDLGRLHDIAAVLIRYGFGDQVRRIGLAGALEQAGRVLHWRAPEELALLEQPARVRRALEELGPTFVKLGQILATRVDLFPPEWIAEFGKLQDAAPAVPFDALRAQLGEDLGASPEEVFEALETEPLAVESLAQVHRAKLVNGDMVVLKVRRPGIRKVVEADLRLLAQLAEIVEAEAPELRRYHPSEVVRQFTATLERELDFAVECRNIERVCDNFADHPEIVVPRVHWQWVCERLNVRADIPGIAGWDLAAVDEAGLDRKRLAHRVADVVLKMMFEDGFFHAAPHPGNVLYLPDNRIAFIGFGMVGLLSDERRYQAAMLMHALLSLDAESLVEALPDWRAETEASGEAQLDCLKGEIGVFVDGYRGLPQKQLVLATLLFDLFAILREHGFVLAVDLTLLAKAFMNLEASVRQLDPDFDMAAYASLILERALLEHRTPAKTIRCGKFRIQVDRTKDLLTLAIYTAGLAIVSAAVMLYVEGGADSTWLPSLRLLGLLGAVAGGMWLLISILRSGRGE